MSLTPSSPGDLRVTSGTQLVCRERGRSETRSIPVPDTVRVSGSRQVVVEDFLGRRRSPLGGLLHHSSVSRDQRNLLTSVSVQMS